MLVGATFLRFDLNPPHSQTKKSPFQLRKGLSRRGRMMSGATLRREHTIPGTIAKPQNKKKVLFNEEKDFQDEGE
jgi:hypothetical protein